MKVEPPSRRPLTGRQRPAAISMAWLPKPNAASLTWTAPSGLCVALPVLLGAQRTSQNIDDINDVFSDMIFPRSSTSQQKAGH
jgi:hypothetical protein